MNVGDKVKINFKKVKLTNISWSEDIQRENEKIKNNQDAIYEVAEVLPNNPYPIVLEGLNKRFKESELIKAED